MLIAERVSQLMPSGVPNYAEIRNYPSIKALTAEIGYKNMHKVIQVLVQNFCDSVNVVRPMNPDQVFEAASYLLDECEGFRIEDYVMMFTMAKRGQFVKIMDRIDITVIAQILDNYWITRDVAGKKLQEQEVKQVDNLLNSKTVEFVPEIQKEMTDWLKSLDEEQEPEEKPVDKSPAKAYAALHGINIQELEKNFPSKSKDNGKTNNMD